MNYSNLAIPVEPKSTSQTRRITARAIVVGIATLLLIINVVCLVYYNVHTVRSLFSTDAAAKNLIAGEMVRASTLFLRDWYYVNGDLWTFFSHLLILPLLTFFPNGFALHAFAGVVTAALILSLSYWFMRMLHAPVLSILLMLAMLASGISSSMAWTIFGETAYGWVLLTSLLFLNLFLYFFRNPEHRVGHTGRLALLLAILCLSFVVHAGNPTRAAASFSIPMAGGLAAVLLGSVISGYGERWQQSAMQAGLPFGALIMGAIAGAVAHSLLIANLNNTLGAASAAFLPLEQLGRSIGYTAIGLISLFGGELVPGRRLPTLLGLSNLVRLFAALLMIGLPLWLLRRCFRQMIASQQFAAGFATTSFAIVLAVCLLTNTPDYSDFSWVSASMRYFAPSMILLLIISASVAHKVSSRAWQSIAVATALIISAYGWDTLVAGRAHDTRMAVIDTLRQNGLTYGYGSYWNAGAFTVLSSQDVKVRQVQFTNSGIIPMRHLSSSRWYSGNDVKGKTFLLITDKEHRSLQSLGLLDCPQRPLETLQVASMLILVYAEDFSKRTLGWETDHPTFERERCLALQTPRTVGRFVAESKTLVSVPQDGPGYLMFGPYLSLQAGDYAIRATFEIGDGSTASAGILDVVGEGGNAKFAETALPSKSGRRTIELPFTLQRDARLVEFRVLVSGSAPVSIHHVALIRRNLFFQRVRG